MQTLNGILKIIIVLLKLKAKKGRQKINLLVQSKVEIRSGSLSGSLYYFDLQLSPINSYFSVRILKFTPPKLQVIRYAIVDIETTGGHASQHNIIEIAIVISDGEKVLHKYETLVNPGRPIPRFITGLTGINNAAVEKSPAFAQIAPYVYELLKDCIFVAHNVNFDYSFVRNELDASNFIFNPDKLCTLRLSRRIFSGYKHYSLGNICSFLGIDIENRHRAMGDAYATCELLHKLIAHDENKEIAKALRKKSGEQKLPPNLPKEQFENLPTTTGVYYFHDEHRKIIYVGKAINIKKRISSHFTGNIKNPQRQAFLRDIYSISYELTGNELIALLHEASEIRSYWPKYNSAQKKPERNYGVYEYMGIDGYKRLAIDSISKINNHPLARFDTFSEAHDCLLKLVMENELCLSKTSIRTTGSATDNCAANCHCKESVKSYNKRVNKTISLLETGNRNYAITAKGRTPDELSFIIIRENQYRGYGFVNADSFSLDSAEKFIKPVKHNHTAIQVIESFTSRYIEDYKTMVLE